MPAARSSRRATEGVKPVGLTPSIGRGSVQVRAPVQLQVDIGRASVSASGLCDPVSGLVRLDGHQTPAVVSDDDEAELLGEKGVRDLDKHKLGAGSGFGYLGARTFETLRSFPEPDNISSLNENRLQTWETIS